MAVRSDCVNNTCTQIAYGYINPLETVPSPCRCFLVHIATESVEISQGIDYDGIAPSSGRYMHVCGKGKGNEDEPQLSKRPADSPEIAKPVQRLAAKKKAWSQMRISISRGNPAA